MNIYAIRAYGQWCAGLVIVAAKGEKSASKVAAKYKADLGRASFNIDYAATNIEISLLANDPSITKAKVLKLFEYGE